MNALKKYLGFVWIICGFIIAVLLPYWAIKSISTDGAGVEDMVFWTVVVIIFIPITIGFILFGFYAARGEYSVV